MKCDLKTAVVINFRQVKKLIALTILHLFATILLSQESLVAYYPFNGNANDESGNNHHGIVTGATLAKDRNEINNSAYYFDGSSYITIDAADSVLNVNSNGFTLSFWVKPIKNQSVSSAPIVSYGYGSAGGYCVAYWEQYGMFRTTFYDYSWSGIYVAIDELNDYDWYMYTFTYDGNTLKEFINGVFINETKGSYFPTTPTGTYTLKFGAESKNANNLFKGYIDDIRIYNIALTDIEVANLSGFSGAIRATELNAYSLADFELNTLRPIKFSNFWAIWGSSTDLESYAKSVENPVKDGANTSDYVGVAVTFPSNVSEYDSHKKEYVLTSANGLLDNHHHIMQWKILFPDSTLLKLDTIVWNWMSFNQIHGGCELYDGGNCESGGSIAYGGGIFNDNVKAANSDKSVYQFRYRAMPDSARIFYNVDIGKWMTFTYEILWTHSKSGYWRIWKNGVLLGSAENVKTLPDCCDDDDNFLHFKTGLYNKWYDDEIDSLSLYFDDIELYIGNNINIKQICPSCSTDGILNTYIQKEANAHINIFPNPIKDRFTIHGDELPTSVAIYSLDGRKLMCDEKTNIINISTLCKGVYIVAINIKGTLFVKKIIKE